MKHFIILLFLFSVANGQIKKRKLRQQIHDLEIKLVHCQAKNCDTILKCPTKREVKAKTKRLKHAEKTKRTALELESKVLALKQQNKRVELKISRKKNRTKEKEKTKRNAIFQFFTTIKGITKSLTITQLAGVGGGITGLLTLIGGFFEKYKPITTIIEKIR